VDVDNAVKAAKEAFPAWSRLSFQDRANYMDKIASLIDQNRDLLAQLESKDTGKPLSLAKAVDIPRAISNFRFFAGAVRHDYTKCHQMADALNYTTRSPVGVAGLITPWNLPIYLLSWKVAPALAMGNTVIAKPSELTPLSAAYLAQIIHDAGLPAGVFNLVHGYGNEAGHSIVSHQDVSLISFTGGTETGKTVASTAASMFKKLSLELGGKNATIVFGDCNFSEAVDGTFRAAFTNQGQVCLSGSRVFIEDTIYKKFVDELKKKKLCN